RQRVGQEAPRFVLQRVKLRGIEDVVEHEITETLEVFDLLLTQRRVRAPRAIDDGILARQQFGLRPAAGWIDILHDRSLWGVSAGGCGLSSLLGSRIGAALVVDLAPGNRRIENAGGQNVGFGTDDVPVVLIERIENARLQL